MRTATAAAKSKTVPGQYEAKATPGFNCGASKHTTATTPRPTSREDVSKADDEFIDLDYTQVRTEADARASPSATTSGESPSSTTETTGSVLRWIFRLAILTLNHGEHADRPPPFRLSLPPLQRCKGMCRATTSTPPARGAAGV